MYIPLDCICQLQWYNLGETLMTETQHDTNKSIDWDLVTLSLNLTTSNIHVRVCKLEQTCLLVL